MAEGEIVTRRVDLAMFHDSSGPRRLEPMLREVGARLWDPARVVLVIDHYVPESDEESRRIVRIAREWAVRERLPNLYDSQGIRHVVLPQGGHLRPGMFCVGGDSHSLHRRRLRRLHVRHRQHRDAGRGRHRRHLGGVPRTLMMRWNGRLGAGVTART